MSLKEGDIMTKKTKIDFITSVILLICSSVVMLLPLFNIVNVKSIFLFIMCVYIISNLINYLLVKESKDREGLYTVLISIISIVLLFLFDVTKKPVNLALVLLMWTFGMSLVKLKKADYYHDRNNRLWFTLIVTLFIFILIGLLTAINLYYASSVQVLMIGNFFFINGVLDLIDPLTNCIKEND